MKKHKLSFAVNKSHQAAHQVPESSPQAAPFSTSQKTEKLKNSDLKKLSRPELLELLVFQSHRIDELEERLNEATEELESRDIAISECGSLAEASLRLSGIFEAADEAARLYVENARASAAAHTQNPRETKTFQRIRPRQFQEYRSYREIQSDNKLQRNSELQKSQQPNTPKTKKNKKSAIPKV